MTKPIVRGGLFDLSVPAAEGPKASGSQPWSSAEQYVIVSIDNEDVWQSRILFEQALAERNIGFKPVKGAYAGKSEHSWILNARDWPLIREWQPFEGQESVLHLGRYKNGAREATLWLGNALPVALGWFQQVSKAYALAHDHTDDGGEFYATLPNPPGQVKLPHLAANLGFRFV